MPDRMPENMTDKRPEGLSDRMPADLPGTTRRAVMVGVTRNKGIREYITYKYRIYHIYHFILSDFL
jgi:hypothetical protein